jgi:hypothetical protein
VDVAMLSQSGGHGVKPLTLRHAQRNLSQTYIHLLEAQHLDSFTFTYVPLYSFTFVAQSVGDSDCGLEGMGFDPHSGQSKVRLFSLFILTDKIVLVV